MKPMTVRSMMITTLPFPVREQGSRSKTDGRGAMPIDSDMTNPVSADDCDVKKDVIILRACPLRDKTDDNALEAVMDSGCSYTATPYPQILNGASANDSITLLTASNSELVSSDVGYLGSLPAAHFEDMQGMTLVSVHQMTKLGYRVIMDEDACLVVNKATSEILITGYVRDGIYIASIDDIKKLSQVHRAFLAGDGGSLPRQPTDDGALDAKKADRCHCSLSHEGNAAILYAVENNICEGIDISRTQFHPRRRPLCRICAISKMDRMKLKRVYYRQPQYIPQVGQRLHVDIQGPMVSPSYDGYRYLLLGMDYASKYCMVAPMRSKGEAMDIIKRWIVEEFRAHDHHLCTIKCDNDSVFEDHSLVSALADQGITYEFSQTYNPEQNAHIERQFAHLTTLMRCNLNQYHQIHQTYPIKLWPEAFSYAAWIDNRIRPGRFDELTSRFSLFTKKQSDVRQAVPWGTEGVFAARDIRSKTSLSKLDDRGVIGVFIGFDSKHYPGIIMMTKGTPILKYVVAHVMWDWAKNDHGFTRSAAHHQEFEDPTVPPDVPISLEFHEIRGSAEVDKHTLDDDTTKPVKKLRFKDDMSWYEGRETRSRKSVVQDVTIDSSLDDDDTSVQSLDSQLPHEPDSASTTFGGSSLLLHAYIAQHSGSRAKIFVPKSYHEAISCPAREIWIRAMKSEMEKQLNMETYSKTRLAPSRRPSNITKSKWVFTHSYTVDGAHKYKARMVARGFSQREGIDFDLTYSPVARNETTKFFFARSVHLNRKIHQMDVDSAYLYAQMDKRIPMEAPLGCRRDDDISLVPSEWICDDDEVYVLEKALYGTKQAGRMWYLHIKSFIINTLGFQPTYSDPCLFLRDTDDDHSEILLYVDDLLIASDDERTTIEVKKQFSSSYKMKDLGICRRFLGIDVCQDFTSKTITLSAAEYTRSIISEFGFDDDSICPPQSIPLNPTTKYSKTQCPEDSATQQRMARFPYAQLVGKLSYLQDKLRHDIGPHLTTLNGFTSNPAFDHWLGLVSICGYLKTTIGMKLVYNGQTRNPQLIAYADANLADGINETRSRTGGAIFFGDCLIRAICRRQTEVSTNTAGAEIIALHEVVSDVRYLRNMVSEITGKEYGPTIIFEDNKAVLDLMEAPGKKTKYHELRTASIREQQEFRNILITQIDSKYNLADFFTKILNRSDFENLRHALGFRL